MEFTDKPLESFVTLSPITQEKPELTFWFQKKDGTYFGCKMEEAWNVLKHPNRVQTDEGMMKERHKYLGASNGTVYFQLLQEAKKAYKEQGVEAAQVILREAEVKERESADISIKPNNMDYMGDKESVRGMRELYG